MHGDGGLVNSPFAQLNSPLGVPIILSESQNVLGN